MVPYSRVGGCISAGGGAFSRSVGGGVPGAGSSISFSLTLSALEDTVELAREVAMT